MNQKITRKKGQTKRVVVSGGFDPIHVGHIRLIKEAAKLGTELVVVINNDNWLMDKKGFVFMPQDERKEIIESITGVSRVVFTDHAPGEYFKDRSVNRAIASVQPHIFANGGDRKPDGDPVPEVILCNELGIELVYNVGAGGKVQSSSWLVDQARKVKEIRAVTPKLEKKKRARK